MTFGERLRQTRKNKGYTQKTLASIIGIAKSTLTGYEKDNREPDVIKIKKLAEALSVSADYLLGVDCRPTIPVNRVELCESEHLLIKKYRTLDENGKRTVDLIINDQYKRCVEISNNDVEFSKEIC